MPRLTQLLLCQLLLTLALMLPAPLRAGSYDPLALSSIQDITWQDLRVADAKRQREIPIRIYLPATNAPAPVILFSHGLGGSRENAAYLGQHWAARGYLCVFLQHPGSDEDVWKGKSRLQQFRSLKRAASFDNLLLRIGDVSAVLDQLTRWNLTHGHPLAGRLDLTRVGMSGHSFGAVTTQAVSGERFDGSRTVTSDPRIKAALIMSPSSPRRGDPQAAFGKVTTPWLLMTGTKDSVPLLGIDLDARLSVFPALPAGGKYELVLDGAQHAAFGDGPLRKPGETRNPNHHRAILAISTAFWDAWLSKRPDARAWLDGSGPRTVLEERDRWQKK